MVDLNAEGDDQATLLARLGPHTTGASCLHLKRLADVDLAVLEQLVARSLAALRRWYPAHGN